jgi:hypothetical protein
VGRWGILSSTSDSFVSYQKNVLSREEIVEGVGQGLLVSESKMAAYL